MVYCTVAKVEKCDVEIVCGGVGVELRPIEVRLSRSRELAVRSPLCSGSAN